MANIQARRIMIGLGAAALLLSGAACSGDDSGTGDNFTASSPTATATATATATTTATTTAATTTTSTTTEGTSTSTTTGPESTTDPDTGSTGETTGEPLGYCGDGMLDEGEECDDGEANSDTAACTLACKTATCGDAYVQEGVEECDDGNDDNTDACLDTCLSATCGDGFVQSRIEACDDGNDDDLDECSNTCKLATCGDGVAQGDEECDDGNDDNTDECTDVCLNATCGDSYLQGDEECDDGNDVDDDECSNECTIVVNNVSCKAIKADNPAAKDGVYQLDLDGPGPKQPFEVYCDMTTDGGGWQIMNYLRKPNHWDIPIFTDSGTVGDTVNGFSSGATLQAQNDQFSERIIIYLKLMENGVSQGKQWMVSHRQAPIPFASINSTNGGWGYRDSRGYTDGTVGNVCTHGCSTYRGFGMFHDYENGFGWCGTQGGNYGCRDGNNICWMPHSLGCNVGGARCAYLINDGEGALYGVR